MSRSGYSDDLDPLDLGRWRGQVNSAIRGHRGQKLLQDLKTALEALPQKRLIVDQLVASTGEVCALGAVAVHRGMDVTSVDAEDRVSVGQAFNIAHQLAAEIAYINDDGGWRHDTPEERYQRVYRWVCEHLK